jgi:hypothetical protein
MPGKIKTGLNAFFSISQTLNTGTSALKIQVVQFLLTLVIKTNNNEEFTA